MPLTLGQIVKRDTGHDVYQANQELVNKIGKTVEELKASGKRYHVKRINEANAPLLSDTIDVLSRHGFRIRILEGITYPDSVIELNGINKYAYLDVRVTTSYGGPSRSRRYRAVYYTTGEKIEHPGYHICLRYFMRRKSMDSNVWLVDYWNIMDLMKAELRLKHEYSVHNNELDSRIVYSSLSYFK